MFALIDRLGTSDDLIPITGHAGAWRDERLSTLRPGSLRDYVTTPILSFPSKLQLLKLAFRVLVHYRELDWQAWDRAHALDRGDMASYVRATLDEDILEYLFQPFFSGYWYAAPEETSSALALLLFKHLGTRELTYRGGLGAIPERLARDLDVRLECEVQQIDAHPSRDGRLQVSVRCAGREERLPADAVVCALRAPEALSVLSPDFRSERSFLEGIRYGSSVVVALPIERPIHPDMWGLLLPRREFDLLASVVLEHAKPEATQRVPKGKGLLMDYVHEEILRSFGELPAEIYSDPPRIGGIRWHYGNELGAHDTAFDLPAHFVVRKDFDNWLNRMSGAEIRDQVTLLDLAMEGGVVRLRIRTPAGEEELACRYVVGADGDNGAVLRKLAPEFFAREVKPHRFMMGKVHYEGDIDLDKTLWHSFVDAEYGAMTLVAQKDATVTIENCVKEAADFPMVHARLVEHLERTHGFRRARVAKRELLARSQMAAMGIFHPGRGNVLLAGETSGLSRLWGEGIGPALVSGREVGEAVATCMRSGRSALQEYRPAFTRHCRAIAVEWNTIKLLVGRPGNVGQMDPKKAISELAFPERWRLLSQLVRQMGGFGGGRRVVGASLRSLWYPQERGC